MCQRALRDAQPSARLRRHPSLAANARLSMQEKKRKVTRNLRRLESLGLLDSANQYQALIDELAKVCWGMLSWDHPETPGAPALVKLTMTHFGFLAPLFPPGHPEPAAPPAAAPQGAPEAEADPGGPRCQNSVL